MDLRRAEGRGDAGTNVYVHKPATAHRTSRVISDIDEFAGLSDDWEALRTDIEGPTATFDYILAHASALRSEDRFCAVTVFDGDRLTAVAPLVLVGSATRHLEWIDTGDAGAAFYLDEQRLRHLVSAIYGLRRPLLIDALTPGSAIERALVDGRPRGWIAIARPWLGGPSLPLDDTWLDPASKLGKKRASEMRRTARKAQAIGEVVLEVCTPTSADELAVLFDEFVAVEASGWKGRAGTALVHDRPQREGLRRYLAVATGTASVRITRMRIGDATAAIHLNAVGSGRWWGLKGAVDETFKAVTPGLHLFAHTIRSAAEEGLHTFEFMGATAPFKELWGAGPKPLTRYRIYPPSAVGFAGLTIDVSTKGREELSRHSKRQLRSVAAQIRDRVHGRIGGR